MYIFNISFMVEYAAHDRWLEMMKDKFLPFVRENGYNDLVFTRVISNDSPGEFTYSLQVHMDDMGQYNSFSERVMDEYMAIFPAVFGEKVLHFSTLLKKVDIL